MGKTFLEMISDLKVENRTISTENAEAMAELPEYARGGRLCSGISHVCGLLKKSEDAREALRVFLATERTENEALKAALLRALARHHLTFSGSLTAAIRILEDEPDGQHDADCALIGRDSETLLELGQ